MAGDEDAQIKAAETKAAEIKAAELKAAVKKQRSVRGGFSGHLTRLLQEIGDVSESPDPESITILQERLAASSNKVKEASDKLLDLLEDEVEIETEVTFQAEVTDNVLIAEVKLRSLLYDPSEKEKNKNSPPASHCSERSHNTNSYAGLPKLSLPKFSGNPLDWRPFYDQFKASVDERDIPAVQKFTYLVSALERTARETLKGISCTAQNYPEAIKILKGRFGDPAMLIGLYAEKISDLKPVEDGDTKGFRALIDTFESSFRELTHLIHEVLYPDAAVESILKTEDKIEIHHLFLTPVLTRRLPPSTHQEWLRRTTEPLDRFNLTTLLKFVKKEIEAQEILMTRTKEPFKKNSQPIQSQQPSREIQRPKSATKAFISTTGKKSPSSNASNNKSPCTYCKKLEHAIYKCPDLLKLEPTSRKESCNLKQICTNCLGSKHLANSCPSKFKCFKCSDPHHTLLHIDDQGTSGNRTSDKPKINFRVSDIAQSTQTVLQTATVFVKGLDRPVRVLLDTGAEISYMTDSLAAAVKPQLMDRGFHQYEGFGGFVSSPEERSAYRLEFRSRHSPKDWLQVRLVSVPKLCGPQNAISLHHFSSMLNEVGKIPLADIFSPHEMQIDIIFGLDSIPQILLQEPPIKYQKLILTPTRLGYVVGGSLASSTSSSTTFAAITKILRVGPSRSDITKSDPITQMWKLDAVGISKEENVQDSVITPVRRGERYEIPLPWITDERPQFSKSQAIRRLHSSFLKLSPEAKEEYISTIENYHELGILEEADGKNGNFLPHHSVVSAKKRRIVYDASATPWKGPPLNELLYPGPNLLADLTAILMRFRTHRIPLCADVEKAFLMVGVDPSDREFLKLVWIDRNNSLRVSRFTRVPFGINAGPYLLLKTLQHHFLQLKGISDSRDKILDLIEESLYMDDLVSGAESNAEIQQLKSEAKEIFKQAGMNLQHFISFPELMEKWSSEPPPTVHKVLGIPWNLTSDTFNIQLELSAGKTRREVLSAVASIFDPLGLVSPWLIRAKIFIQSLWTDGGEWDDQLSPARLEQWKDIVSEVHRLNFVAEFPRRIQGTELHVFVDASRQAYAAAIYMKSHNSTQLLCSKARVAPLRPESLTIPRLELMANLVGARLAAFVCKCLKIPHHSVRFHTDSMICIGWIQGSPTEVFIRNRVREIKLLFEPQQWSHVIGIENPADLPTRGISASELISSKLWHHGPAFLLESSPPCTTVLVNRQIHFDYMDPFPASDYSSLKKLKRVMAWINRWINRIKLKDRSIGPFTQQELSNASISLLRSCQLINAPEDYHALMGGEDVSAKSTLWNARPYFDKKTGLIMSNPRHRGKSQPWLPMPSALARLIVHNTHLTLYHLGVPSVVAELNRTYWSIKTRSFVKSVLSNCNPCKRLQTRSIISPEGALPLFRSTPSKPFRNTGLDHFGPLYLKDGTKIWVLIFTCSVIRAIDLEIVTSLNTTETSLAIRRFFSRWGPASMFMSDNGSSFVKLAKSLPPDIDWKFIPPAAPWWGGFWERMIGTVKRSLKKTLGNSGLSLSELSTVLAELADRINRRPLVSESETPLTPTHFLKGLPPSPVQDDLFHSEQKTMDNLNRRWQHRLLVSKHLWKRWTSEYLPTLRQWKRSVCPNPKISDGDIVLVQPPDGSKIPRGLWPLARVETVHLSDYDQKPRSATLRMRGRTTSRPLSRLFPLEAASLVQTSDHPPIASRSKPQPESRPPQPDSTQDELQVAAVPEATSTSRTRFGRHVRPPQRYGLQK